VLCELLLVAAVTLVGANAARLWAESQVGEIAEDGGDPDGDTVVPVIEFLGGAAAFVLALLLVVTFEFFAVGSAPPARRLDRAHRGMSGRSITRCPPSLARSASGAGWPWWPVC
jgi:hypothetical protein